MNEINIKGKRKKRKFIKEYALVWYRLSSSKVNDNRPLIKNYTGIETLEKEFSKELK